MATDAVPQQGGTDPATDKGGRDCLAAAGEPLSKGEPAEL